MRAWTGRDVLQWENARTWNMTAGTFEVSRPDGALMLPGGLDSFTVFLRRYSQTAGQFDLTLYTAPIWLRSLDDDLSSTLGNFAVPVSVNPATGLRMTGTGAQMFAARVGADQPMGSLLFWEMGCSTANGVLVADIYVVPNHKAVLTAPRLARTVDVVGPGGAGIVSPLDRG